MRINIMNFMIALAIGALIAYGFWMLDGSLKTYVGIGSFVFIAGTLSPAIGIHFEFARNATTVRVVCMVFFVVGLVVNLGFAVVGNSATAYIIFSAVSFLIYLFIANLVYNAKQ